jgi:hypothetical protein
MAKEYGWRDVTIQFLGKPVTGARGVKYTAKQESTNIYALGGKPVAYSEGKREFEGEVMILQSELEALQRTLPPRKSILDLKPFDIVVVYTDSEAFIVTDILKGCKFLELTKQLKVDDPFMELTLPIRITDIEYNALLAV